MPDETPSQATWFQAKLYVKPVYNFFSQFIFTHGKFKLSMFMYMFFFYQFDLFQLF